VDSVRAQAQGEAQEDEASPRHDPTSADGPQATSRESNGAPATPSNLSPGVPGLPPPDSAALPQQPEALSDTASHQGSTVWDRGGAVPAPAVTALCTVT